MSLGGGAAHALAACARHAALVVVDPCTTKGHCTSERPLSFGERPCSDKPRPPTHSRLPHVRTRDRTTALALSLEEAQHGRARLPRRAGCGRLTHNERPVHQQEASLLLCKAVLRHASRGRQHTAGFHVCAHAIASLRSLSLSRTRSTRACRARLPRALAAPRWLWSTHLLRKTTAPARSLPHSVQGSAATCQLRLPRKAGFYVCAHAGAPLLTLSLERRRSTRASRACALAHAGWVAPRLTKGQCTGERPLSFGARPCCDVAAATSSLRSRL